MLGQPMRNNKMNSCDRKMDSTDDRELIFGLGWAWYVVGMRSDEFISKKWTRPMTAS